MSRRPALDEPTTISKMPTKEARMLHFDIHTALFGEALRIIMPMPSGSNKFSAISVTI